MFKSTILLSDVKHQRKKYQISVYYNLPPNMRLNESGAKFDAFNSLNKIVPVIARPFVRPPLLGFNVGFVVYFRESNNLSLLNSTKFDLNKGLRLTRA